MFDLFLFFLNLNFRYSRPRRCFQVMIVLLHFGKKPEAIMDISRTFIYYIKHVCFLDSLIRKDKLNVK